MTDFTIQTNIAETLSTVENLIKCLDEKERQEPHHLLLSGAIEFYRSNNMEKFSIVMLNVITQVSVELINKVKEELEEK